MLSLLFNFEKNKTRTVLYICSPPDMMCMMTQVRGQNAVQSFRDTAGPWNVDMAKELRPNSIRAMYGETGVRTGIHCTDLPEDGPSECQFFFELMQSVY